MINQIFIFAAGSGTRMRPLTEKTPKPLLKIGDKTMLDHILDRVRFLKAQNVIINSFYLKKQIKNFAYNHKDPLIISDEFNKIETGGGIKYAIKCGLIDPKQPLLLINGDLYWQENEQFLLDLIEKFHIDRPDILLALVNKREYFGYDGNGDFNMLKGGRIIRDGRNPYAFTGIQIVNPKIFFKSPKEIKFAMNHFYHNKNIKICGMPSKNRFFHIGTPKHLEEINKLSF
jgi:N-acetyl-alpha-D-muramate 1-phosphate uridylyltransferase